MAKGKRLSEIKFSVLDLVPIVEGKTAVDSFQSSLKLAQCIDLLGYHRYWVAEHHNMPGIASSATSVVIGYIAAGTKKIRVGSGGIMLPNHEPLIIAEQFGTLESMYPGRIDLGIGRAPGSDQPTAKALGRHHRNQTVDFPEQLEQLRSYFDPKPGSLVRAIPGEGLDIPIWLLGSSTYSALLAAKLGLPFAFASHFAPDYLLEAIKVYRGNFTPSETLKEPYVMVGVNVIAAETMEKAEWLATSQKQAFLNIIHNNPGKLQPPVEDMEVIWKPYEKSIVEKMLHYSVSGNLVQVQARLEEMAEETKADELIINTSVFDSQDRIRSYELVAELFSR